MSRTIPSLTAEFAAMEADDFDEMKPPIKVALVGKSRSGKDTFAKLLRFLAEDDDVNVWQLGLADPIKEAVRVAMNYEDAPKERLRPVWQALGEVMRQELGEDFWVQRVLQSFNEFTTNGALYLVTDVRRHFEAHALRRDGYYLVKLERDDELRRASSGLSIEEFAEIDRHPTETEVDLIKCDMVVKSTTKAGLFGKADELWQQLTRANS